MMIDKKQTWLLHQLNWNPSCVSQPDDVFTLVNCYLCDRGMMNSIMITGARVCIFQPFGISSGGKSRTGNVSRAELLLRGVPFQEDDDLPDRSLEQKRSRKERKRTSRRSSPSSSWLWYGVEPSFSLGRRLYCPMVLYSYAGRTRPPRFVLYFKETNALSKTHDPVPSQW